MIMITPEEASLTPERHTAIKTHEGLFTAQVLLEQRSLEFAPHSGGQPVGPLFDAARLSSGEIVKCYIQGSQLVQRVLPEDSAEWSEPSVVAEGVDAIRPSIAENGDYVYYMSAGSLYRRSLGTFPEGAAELVWSGALSPLHGKDVTHLAAAADGAVFVALYDQSKFNTNLQMLARSANWGVFNTEIYWPRRLTGLDAISLEDGAHLFVISSDLPPLIGQQVEGTTLRRVAERRNGLVAWRMQNFRSSDHFLIDSFDDASAYQYRKEPRLSKLDDGRVVLTAYGADGKASNHHSTLHYYFSLDGRAWSHNHMISLPATSNGAPMIARDHYVYLIGDSATHISKGTSLIGNTHPDLIEDITSRINSYTSDHSGARQSSYGLRNSGWGGDSLLFKPVQLSIRTLVGVWQGNQPVMTPISTEIVDVVSPSRDKPSESLVIQARDYTALLNGLVRSPHSREYDTQVQGADKYFDFTDTGYGGLAHTAAALGSWSTAANWLVLRSNNKRSVAFNTFKPDAMWCGMIQATIQIDDDQIIPENPEDTEYGGLVFRAYDKDNYMSWEHAPGVGMRLARYINGKREQISQTPMNWGYGTPGHLRVVFRYSKVSMYYSNDGRQWHLYGHYIIPGQPPVEPDTPDAPLYYEDGLVGFCGLGYSKDDVWPEPPSAPYIPPTTPGGHPWGTGNKSAIIALRAQSIGHVSNPGVYGVVAYTRAATTGPWVMLHDGIQTLHNGKPAEIANLHLDPFNFGAAYLTFKNGDTYYNPDWRNGAAWQMLASALNLQAACNAAHGVNYDHIDNMTVSMAAEGHILLSASIRVNWGDVRRTGALIRVRRIENGIDVSPPMRRTSGGYADQPYSSFPFGHFGNRIPTLVMAVIEGDLDNRQNHAVWVCDWTTTGHDWSCFPLATYGGIQVWTPRCQIDRQSTDASKEAVIWSPYTRDDGSENEEDMQLFLAGPGNRIWKSDDQGYTFVPYTEAGTCPRVPRGGARPDTWELNMTDGTMIHMIRASGDVNTPDQLILGKNGSWTSAALPMKNMVGWSGGFPGRDGQFYIGANRYPSWSDSSIHALPPDYTRHPWVKDLPPGRDMLLMFTKDGGATWSNWTHNLWTLVSQTTFGYVCSTGVVRMYPHPLER